MSFGLNRLDLAGLQNAGPLWTPPPNTPTPALLEAAGADPAALPVEGAGTFQPGEPVRNITNSRVNIRKTPGYQTKPPDDILAQVNPGELVQILGGRTQLDNLTWWLVGYNGVEGWMAEATASGVQILGR